jgi:hypothetical protein
MNTTLALDNRFFSSFFTDDRGRSVEAGKLKKELTIAASFQGSMSLGESKRASKIALITAYAPARHKNWDGEGAMAISPLTFIYALRFLEALPSNLPAPDISADTDGEILFEWNLDRRLGLSVSVGQDGKLSYAGLFGTNKAHGVEDFGDYIPGPIEICLGRLAPAS